MPADRDVRCCPAQHPGLISATAGSHADTPSGESIRTSYPDLAQGRRNDAPLPGWWYAERSAAWVDGAIALLSQPRSAGRFNAATGIGGTADQYRVAAANHSRCRPIRKASRWQVVIAPATAVAVEVIVATGVAMTVAAMTAAAGLTEEAPTGPTMAGVETLPTPRATVAPTTPAVFEVDA